MILDKAVVCPVFIGRQKDLQSLDRLIAQLGDKRGQIALISGEAGIGKSRLVKEAKARVWFLKESRRVSPIYRAVYKLRGNLPEIQKSQSRKPLESVLKFH